MTIETTRNFIPMILRRIAEIGQSTVAESCGVNVSTVSRWMSGALAIPLEKLPVLFECLGLYVSEDSTSTQEITIPNEHYDALRTLAREALS